MLVSRSVQIVCVWVWNWFVGYTHSYPSLIFRHTLVHRSSRLEVLCDPRGKYTIFKPACQKTACQKLTCWKPVTLINVPERDCDVRTYICMCRENRSLIQSLTLMFSKLWENYLLSTIVWNSSVFIENLPSTQKAFYLRFILKPACTLWV